MRAGTTSFKKKIEKPKPGYQIPF